MVGQHDGAVLHQGHIEENARVSLRAADSVLVELDLGAHLDLLDLVGFRCEQALGDIESREGDRQPEGERPARSEPQPMRAAQPGQIHRKVTE